MTQDIHYEAYKVISDSESDEMAVDKEEDEPEVDKVTSPDLQADMARFPGMTRKEVLVARELWASNSIQFIHHEDDDDGEDPASASIFVSRSLICAASGRARTMFPARSWPIVLWEDFVGGRFQARADEFWHWLPHFLLFLHTGTRRSLVREDEPDMNLNREWCLGAALEAPKYQNFVMKEKMTFSAGAEDDFRNEYDTLSMCIGEDAEALAGMGLISIGGGKFQKNMLARYIIDKVVWDERKGGGVWLEIVHRGGCIATFIAKAQAEASKKPAPRFPPWHIFNRYKYLLSEVTDAPQD